MEKLYEYSDKKKFLKMGVTVKVELNGLFEERIFIKRSDNGSIICVQGCDTDRYLVGDDFRTLKWPRDEWDVSN